MTWPAAVVAVAVIVGASLIAYLAARAARKSAEVDRLQDDAEARARQDEAREEGKRRRQRVAARWPETLYRFVMGHRSRRPEDE